MHFLTSKEQQWRIIWPARLIGLLAIIQLISTFIIVGLEVTSVVFDAYHSMIFAGFFCSFFFLITWISMFTVVCCNRHSFGCAAHVLVENILSIIAASVLIYFDSLFIQNPYTCLYASTYDCSRSYYGSYRYTIYDSTVYTVKMICIKVQLAFAAIMLVTNIIYIIIFIIVAIKTRKENSQVVMPKVAREPVIHQPKPVSPIYVTPIAQQRMIECQNCHTLISIA